MKRPIDLARRFLLMAERDIQVFQKLSGDPDIHDSAVGFHAQQALEKCLKAVLAIHQIPFRKTHNLDELLDLLKDQGKVLPPSPDRLDIFTPYAVTLRYDLMELEPLNRDQARGVVEAVWRWAVEQIG